MLSEEVLLPISYSCQVRVRFKDLLIGKDDATVIKAFITKNSAASYPECMPKKGADLVDRKALGMVMLRLYHAFTCLPSRKTPTYQVPFYFPWIRTIKDLIIDDHDLSQELYQERAFVACCFLGFYDKAKRCIPLTEPLKRTETWNKTSLASLKIQNIFVQMFKAFRTFRASMIGWMPFGVSKDEKHAHTFYVKNREYFIRLFAFGPDVASFFCADNHLKLMMEICNLVRNQVLHLDPIQHRWYNLIQVK